MKSEAAVAILASEGLAQVAVNCQHARRSFVLSFHALICSSPSALPSTANSAAKDADMHEDEICECVDCACVECACGGLERGCREDNLAHCTLFCILHFVLCLVADQELFCFCSE